MHYIRHIAKRCPYMVHGSAYIPDASTFHPFPSPLGRLGGAPSSFPGYPEWLFTRHVGTYLWHVSGGKHSCRRESLEKYLYLAGPRHQFVIRLIANVSLICSVKHHESGPIAGIFKAG